ncbi:sugar phosphate isomerase/epimerase family protein [Dyadobacter frigoris]|uniref:sugar phosphate isomerase/epimerase family protein n=1 Tax=Dyadobacter frigoris TaxID=2576211 RepID=UPI001C700E19|nr:sugar phosphate isomerase/epimerase [Dyadobacter frigoris]GLU55277.1 sugar phosphate isomerase [Dyadobacter frigoris]
MKTRREFLEISSGIVLGGLFYPNLIQAAKVKNIGINLYSVREAMLLNATGTLEKLAKIGYKEIESVKSVKGNYYGLKPKEIKKIMEDLGLNLRSGHVAVNADWQKSIDAAAEAGQKYLISPGLPSAGQTVDNYKRVSETFNLAAEVCKKSNIIFGYHNGGSDFTQENGQVLYDVLLDNSDPDLVKMELDLGWAIVGGADPVKYFDKYPGRFTLWHIKDIKIDKAESTEFGKGRIDITGLLKNQKKSAMKFLFIEQENWDHSALEMPGL